VQTINAQELKFMWDRGEDFLLVNTLAAADFPKTKIPGAASFPEADPDFVNLVLQRTGSKEKTIVLYGANPACTFAGSAAQKLLDAGFVDVLLYEGGAEEWQTFMKAKRSTASKW
jgi:rhodanese-related sulfurtransferase